MLMVEENNALPMDRKQVIRRKVMAIGKISRVYSVLKENPEMVNQLKTLSINGKIPVGVLTQGEQGMKEALTTYNKTKIAKEQKDSHALYNYPTPNHKITTSGREGHSL
ncbi:unnamed protein product [Rhizopus stolonifer]